MMKNDMQRSEANSERRYNRCCRHPCGRSLADRREIRFSFLFRTKSSAIDFGRYILGVGQRVQLFSYENNSQFRWQIIVSPAMIPTHENINKYLNMLRLDANRYGGILSDDPIEMAVQEQDKKEHANVLWTFAFPTRDTSLKVGIDLFTHGKRVQAWKLRKQINRWQIAVSATMVPTIENISGYEQKFAEYINAYGGKYMCRGWHYILVDEK